MQQRRVEEAAEAPEEHGRSQSHAGPAAGVLRPGETHAPGPIDVLFTMCPLGVITAAETPVWKLPTQTIMSLLVCLQNDVKMQEIIRYTHLFLQKFCMGNQENQALLHKNLNLFLNPGVLSVDISLFSCRNCSVLHSHCRLHCF